MQKQLNGHFRYQLLYDNGEVEDVVLKPEEDGKVWRHKEAYTNTNNGKRVYSEGNCHIADDKLLLLKGVPIIPQKLWKAVSKCGGIECVRSEDILIVSLQQRHVVPATCTCCASAANALCAF